MHELVYTSAPKGLKPGSQGFCTVACSVGMPPNLMMRLEALSGYRHLFPAGQPSNGVNPVVRSHLVVRVGGMDWHVLSRIADAGIDYTQRSNKIAHHIVFEASELSPSGPAALLACESRFFCTWEGEPKLIMKPTAFPQIKSQPGICKSWERMTGDAGWGGVLAETVRENRLVNLVVTPEMDAMALFEEAAALLPPDLRRQTTLTTYYTRFPSGVSCRWRCIIAGSPEMSQIGLTPDAMVIDLTQPLRTPVPSPLVKAARSGKVPTTLINVPGITGISATRDAERQTGGTLPDRQPEIRDDTASQSRDGNESVETVPIAKPGKKAKTRKRHKRDRFHENREQWLNDTKEQEKWGLLLLLGLGLLFIGIPALLIAAMIFAKNR
jgi:hypothetical protein